MLRKIILFTKKEEINCTQHFVIWSDTKCGINIPKINIY